jgi:putative DNA primase/helicase
LLDVLRPLVWRPLSTANATAPTIFRVVETQQPTLLIDEADTFLRDNDELRGVLNSGHRHGGSVLLTVGDDHEPRAFATYCPCAIALRQAAADARGPLHHHRAAPATGK